MNDQIQRALEVMADRGPDPGATEVWQRAFEAAPKRRRRNRSLAAVSAATVVVLIAGIATALRSDPSRSSQVVVAPTTATTLTPAPIHPVTMFNRLVESGNPVQQVALDADGGAWFVYGQALKHLDAAGSVIAIHLPEGFTVIQDTTSPQLAVDPDGTVWMLGPTDLAEVPRGASSASLIPFGPLPSNPFAEGVPHSPSALASDGDDHVAVAFSGTSVVRMYDTSTGAFTDVHLPRNTDALSLRYFGDGRLAIGLETFGDGKPPITAVIANADGSRSQPIHVRDSTLVNPYSDTAVLFGGIRPTILESDGTTHPIPLPVGVRSYTQIGGVQVGHNGALIVPTGTGITFLTGASSPSVTATYAYRTSNEPCGPDGTGPTPTGATGGCRIPPRVAVAADGAVWVFNVLPTGSAARFLVQRIDRY